MTIRSRRLLGAAAVLTTAGLLAGLAVPAGAQTDAKSVGLLFDITGRGDKSFNDSAAAGLDKFKAEFPAIKATESAPSAGDGSDRPERLKTMIDQGSKMIVCVGFLWKTACEAGAKANAGVQFAIVDDTIDSPNAAGLLFAEQEGSYLVGVAAALASKTNRIGFIGGVQIDLIKKFEAGFVAGVKSVKPKAFIDIKYVTQPPDFGGFNDAAKGRAIATSMYRNRVDVIYHAAGGTGAGVFAAAKASGKKPGQIWAIGVDSDQYQSVAVANGRDYILTSMLKRVDVATYESLTAYNSGKPLSGVQTFDLKRNGVAYATSNPAIRPYQAKIDKARADIIAGKIVVPTAP